MCVFESGLLVYFKGKVIGNSSFPLWPRSGTPGRVGSSAVPARPVRGGGGVARGLLASSETRS